MVSLGEIDPEVKSLHENLEPESASRTRYSTIDPITLETRWNRLVSIADEIDTATIRTSFSTIVGESHDFGCIMMNQDGAGIAQAQWSPPGFCTRLPRVARVMLKKFPQESLEPGDVLITNDPWIGSGHLPDYKVVTPVFYKGRLVAFFGTSAHVSDVGGSGNPLARDVYEEGIRILPTYFYRAGEPVAPVHEIIAANCRVPEMVMGDLNAIVGTHKVASRRLHEFLDDYQEDDIRALSAEILNRSERALRNAIQALPDGVHHAELTCDGYIDPVVLKVRVEIRGSEMYCDFTGSSPERPGSSINTSFNMTYANAIYPIKCMLVPSIPNNDGLVRPLHISAPEGSILNCRFPLAVQQRAKIGKHIPPVVFEALAPLLPERVIAAAGGIYGFGISGEEPRFGRFNVSVLNHGGLGATRDRDGWPPVAYPHNSTLTPTEIMEIKCPVIMLRRVLRPDSGGPGRTRGGLGQDIVLRCVSDQPIGLRVSPDMIYYPAQGLDGGHPGASAAVYLNGESLDRLTRQEFRHGDECLMRIPGGGGYGNPKERDPALVRQDVELGFVTPEAARDVYGVDLC